MKKLKNIWLFKKNHSSLLSKYIRTFLGKELINYFLNRIKGNAPMVVGRKQPAVQRSAYVCISHLRGRSSFVTILNNMKHIKNYTRECMASIFGAGLKLHIQEGGLS